MGFLNTIRTITAKSYFFRNVARLVQGTLISQGLLIASLPILTRIYTPEAFSEFAVFTAIISLITPVVNGRFEIAIPVAKHQPEAIELLKLCLIFSLFLGAAFFLISWLTFDYTLKKVGLDKNIYIFLIPASVLLIGIYNALQFWLTRQKNFKLISRTRVRQTLLNIAAQIGFSFFTPIAQNGLVYGNVFSFTGGLASMLRAAPKLSALTRIRANRLVAAFKKNINYLMYSTPDALVNAASTQAPFLVIAYYATGPEAAYLLLATKFIKIPMTLVGKSVSQVFISHASVYQQSGILRKKTISVMKKMGLIFALPLISGATLAHFAIPYILSPEYSRVGDLIAWMIPWAILMITTSPVAMSLNVLNLQRLGLLVQVFGLASRLGLTLFCGIFFPQYISEAYAISGALYYAAFMAVILWAIRD